MHIPALQSFYYLDDLILVNKATFLIYNKQVISLRRQGQTNSDNSFLSTLSAYQKSMKNQQRRYLI